ncbi:hypothetical protein AVEN_222458-1 [Araneus ventricosus]|uniref:Uncharacterized protein n=1 Tax=Araneus ventricosus TaxID=182803 RepID=A0A4Y2AEI8_ARAVE|nr:hypothetical protein AVEN_52642-1 [Araneus ventricosus]GBL78140.1 hypothetical protein AVEN_222458-1 [Araneus ventricosus]
MHPTFSMFILPGSNLMRLFPVGLFEVQGLSWWGPDVDDLKGKHITGCVLMSSLMRLFPVGLFEVQGLSRWGPDVDDLTGKHITGCVGHSW